MNRKIDLLAVITVLGGQAANLTQAMREQGYRFTEVASHLSLVEQSFTSLLVGLNHEQVDDLRNLMRQHCPERLQYVPVRLDSAFNVQPLMIEALQGGASITIFEVEQFLQI